MKYNNIIEGVFLNRPNRFIAQVLIDGQIHLAHVKNTGRCRELLLPNTRVFLEEVTDNPNRKTKFSLIGLLKGDRFINIDSQVPNKVIYEAILEDKITSLEATDFLKAESTYKNSRFDIFFQRGREKGYIEVKGVTLENNNIASFPDAPTERGTKHLKELIASIEDGFSAYLIFLIQIENIDLFKPNYGTDPNFSKALKLAHDKGVNILAYDSIVTKDSIEINKPVMVDLNF